MFDNKVGGIINRLPYVSVLCKRQERQNLGSRKKIKIYSFEIC
jgi:hypothetical protein